MASSLIQRAPNLAEQAYNALRQDIIAGRLAPGQSVVIEHLAVQLGVSPTPVREALQRLVEKGLISQASTGRWQVVELTEDYVRDVFYVRGALEGLAAELATPHMTEEMLGGLRRMLDDTSAALGQGDFEVYTATDARLHQLIHDCAANSVLHNQLAGIQSHIDLIRGYSQRHAGEHVSLSHQEHYTILQALLSRDPAAARQAMEQHIRNACERIVKLINFQGETYAPFPHPPSR